MKINKQPKKQMHFAYITLRACNTIIIQHGEITPNNNKKKEQYSHAM